MKCSSQFLILTIWLIAASLAVTPLAATEIKGKVTKATDQVVEITTQSEYLPNVGDKVEIYFEIPGLDEPVEVGTGKVTEIAADHIAATINTAKTKLTRNQLARITSDKPRKRGTSIPVPHPGPAATDTKTASPKPDPAIPKPSPSNLPPPGKVGLLLTLSGKIRTPCAVAFSVDSRQAMAYADGFEEWDVQSGKPGRQLPIEGGAVCAAFSTDRRLMLTGNRMGQVRLWDLQTGKKLRQFNGNDSEIGEVTFSRDGKLVASCAGTINLAGPEAIDCTIRVWDIETGQQLQCFTGHKAPVMDVVISPHAKYALSAGSDRSIRLWDMKTGAEVRRYLETEPLAVTGVVFAPAAASFLSISAGPPATLQETEPFPKIAGANRNSTEGAAGQPRGLPIEQQGAFRLRLWDEATGKVLRVFKGHQHEVFCAAFSPDGRRILSGSADRTVRLWDVNSGTELARFEGHELSVLRVAYSTDGRRALSSDFNGAMRVWGLPE